MPVNLIRSNHLIKKKKVFTTSDLHAKLQLISSNLFGCVLLKIQPEETCCIDACDYMQIIMAVKRPTFIDPCSL